MFKKFQESESYRCRWSELFEQLIGDWIVIWECAEVDYQGSAELLAYKDGRFCYTQWTYGSCSGCDPWEGLSEEEALKEAKKDVMFFGDVAILYAWIKMLERTENRKASEFVEALFALGDRLKGRTIDA